VLIAWNCSTEQARATALAMPLLQKADRVTVLTVIGGTEVPGPSAEQLILYLQRNKIVAKPMRVQFDGRNMGKTVLATAQSLGCDLLIKGAYTQSRLRQMIFGGATQYVLENAARHAQATARPPATLPRPPPLRFQYSVSEIYCGPKSRVRFC
jgi:nucleotide-binding universal stress UspA family protein